MIVRIVLVIACAIVGYLVGKKTNHGEETLYYVLFSVGLGLFFVIGEYLLHRIKGRKIAFSFVGMIIGLVLGAFFAELYNTIFPELLPGIDIVIQLLFIYIGFAVGYIKEDELQFAFVSSTGKDTDLTNYKILDTSVIIDGRIADIAETGFLEGVLVVPRFVLKELQQVADSSDPLKRSRGRRGLDILNNMKASKNAIIKITDEDFPEIKEVDSKLLKLARSMNALVITNDFNLNKVAEFQGVKVLNINELSNAVKPIVLPNEEIRINVIKEGKDQNQGIAYLDDGTMIVVDNGKEHIGKEINVIVTSILQTPAGRMIFTQLADDQKK
jgi:uncharacterized protein YacL